jgi:hypothetical protein
MCARTQWSFAACPELVEGSAVSRKRKKEK